MTKRVHCCVSCVGLSWWDRKEFVFILPVNDIKTQMELLREIFNYTLHEADCAYEWVDAFKMLGGPVTRFNSNIDSVVDILNRLEESERSSGFINGMLFSSIYSAYEGFIHEMFEIYCKMEKVLITLFQKRNFLMI